MWFAEIVIVASSFANAPCVVVPSLQLPMASLWIEGTSMLACDDIGCDEWILRGSYLCLFGQRLRNSYSFGGFLGWVVVVGWLGCIARCLTFCTDGVLQKSISSFCFNVTSTHSKNHVEFGISASWAFLCGISSSPNLEEDLVNLLFSSTKCLQCHLVHCGPGTDITSCYSRTIKTPEKFSHFGNSSRLIPCNSKPKSGFIAFWCINDNSEDDDVWKEVLQLKTGSLKSSLKPQMLCSWSWGGGACLGIWWCLFRRFALWKPFTSFINLSIWRW